MDVNLGGHSSIDGSPGDLGQGAGPGRRSKVFAGWAGQVHPLLLIFRKQGFTFLGKFPPTSRPTFFVGQWGEASRALEGQHIWQHIGNLPLCPLPSLGVYMGP